MAGRTGKIALFLLLLASTIFSLDINDISLPESNGSATNIQAQDSSDRSFKLTASTRVGEIRLSSDKKDFPANKNVEFQIEKGRSKGLSGVGQTANSIWQGITDIFGSTPKNPVEIKIIYTGGEVIETKTVDYSEAGEQMEISTDKLKPGTYTLEVTDSSSGTSYKQDFTWGVLAINTNKSIYITGETAKLTMAVLDENGAMVCNAKLRLEIQNSNNKLQILTTEDGSIKVNPECQKKDYTLKPDYSAELSRLKNGVYNLTLTAETENGTHTITDSFEVQDSVDFDIERISATRLYPKYNYPVVIKVKANKDFKGVVGEPVSTKLKVNYLTSGELQQKFDLRENLNEGLVRTLPGQALENNKVINWEVDWKKGGSYTLAYYFKPPEVSPEFFLLGPLKLKDQCKSLRVGDPQGSETTSDPCKSVIFAEQRSWQLANDDVAIPNGVIFAWPSTAGTIPSGWSRVTALDGIYPRGVPNASTNPGTTGGTATHSHTTPAHSHTISHTHATANVAGGTETVGITATGNTADTGEGAHTHSTGVVVATTDSSSAETPVSGAVSNDPAYLSVIWITPTTSATGVPNNAIGLFNDAGLPTNWTTYANSVNRFLKGATTGGDGGGTNGAATHSHTGEGSHTHTSSHTHPGGSTNAGPNVNNTSSDGSLASTDQHTHSYTVVAGNFGASNTQTLTTSTDNHEPPYHEQQIIQNGTGANSFPTGIEGIWRGTLANIPRFWSLCDGNNSTPNLLSDFMRGSTTTDRDTGGVTAHTHTGSNHTHTWASTVHTHTVTIQSTATFLGATGATARSLAAHTHTATSGAAGAVTVGNAAPNLDSASNLPPYEEVAYIRYSKPEIYSGYAYTSNTEGALLVGASICLAINGTQDALDCDTTDAAGYFEIGTTTDTAANAQLTFFIDGGTNFGNTVTVGTGTDISTLKIYQNNVIVRHDNGASITIAQMAAYDNSAGGNSTDMIFDATDSTTDTLTVEDGYTLYIPTSVVFAPAGNLDNGAGVGIDDIKIVGTYTAAAGQTILVSGSWANTGTFTASTSTVTFDAPGATTETINSTGASVASFNNVIFNDLGGGATFQLSSAFDVNGNLTITGGTLDTNGQNITLAGNFDNDDTMTMASATFTFDAQSGTITIDADGTGSEAFFDVIFNDTPGAAATFQLSTLIDVNGSLTITGGNFDANSNSINVAGSWANNDTFTSGTQTTTFDGTTGTISIDGTGTGTSSFSTLTINDNTGNATFQLTSALDVNATFNLTDGILQQNGANNITTAGVVSIGSGATYTKGSGTWTFDGTGSNNYTDATGTQNIGDVTIDAASATRTVALQSAMVMDNLTVAADGVFTMGTQNVTIGNTTDASHGDVNVATGGVTSQSSGTVTILSNSGTTQWNGPGTFTAFSLTIGNGTAFTIDNETNDLVLDLGGNFTIATGAIFTASTTAGFEVAGNWSDTGTFNPSSGLVKLNATSGTPTITTTGSSFNNFEIDDTGNNISWTLQDTMDVNGNLIITGGTFNTNSQNISVGGNFDNDDTLTMVAGTLTMNAISGTPTIDADGTGTDAIYNLTFDDTGNNITFQLTTLLDVDNNLTITGGTFDTNSQNITVGGNFDNDDTLTMVAGTLTMNSTTGGKTIDADGTGTDSIYNLVFDDGGNAGAWTFGADTATISHDLTITGGAVTAPSSTLTIAEDFTNNDSFIHNSGTVVFNTTAASYLLYSATTTFNAVTIATNTKQMYFEDTDGVVTDINGLLTITGTDCTINRVFLDGNGGFGWNINVTDGSTSISYVDVEDSTADGTQITANNSTADNDSNTNWAVNGGVCGGPSPTPTPTPTSAPTSTPGHQPSIRGNTRVKGGVKILYDLFKKNFLASILDKKSRIEV